jgi:antitoxin CptB
MIDQARLNLIRWRARRGLLENDIVLEKYFNRFATTMTEEDLVGLTTLLELSDNDLLDVIMVRKELSDVEIAPAGAVLAAQILATLRSIH